VFITAFILPITVTALLLVIKIAFTFWLLCTPCTSSGKKQMKKNGKNAKKEADIKAMSVVNSNLWQAKLEVVEQSRTEHRLFASRV